MKGSEKRIKRGGQRKEREQPKRKTIDRYHTSDGRRSLAGESGTEVCTRAANATKAAKAIHKAPPRWTSSFVLFVFLLVAILYALLFLSLPQRPRHDRVGPDANILCCPRSRTLASVLRVLLLTCTFLVPVDERSFALSLAAFTRVN